MQMATIDNDLPPVLIVARMQKFGTRYILAEDVAGRHYIVDKLSAGPIRPVIYYEYYFNEVRH